MTTETKELKVFEIFTTDGRGFTVKADKAHWETYDEKKGSRLQFVVGATTVAEIVQSELSYWHTL